MGLRLGDAALPAMWLGRGQVSLKSTWWCYREGTGVMPGAALGPDGLTRGPGNGLQNGKLVLIVT